MKKQIIAAILISSIASGCAKRIYQINEKNEAPIRENTNAESIEASLREENPSIVAIIDKSEQKLIVKENEEIVAEYSVSTGRNSGDKQKVGDCRTPEGEFYLSPPIDSSEWRYQGVLAYGDYFFRVKGSDWKGIGLHGTKGSVGKPKSHGCIRMRNEELLEFKEYHYKENMKLIIQE